MKNNWKKGALHCHTLWSDGNTLPETAIKMFMDEGYDFEEAPGLKTFYGKLMRAAKKKLKEDVDLTFDDIGFDDLDYCVDYPEDLEGEANE